MDTVLDKFMRPKFPGEPDEVRRRLRTAYPDQWTYVLVGETRQVVTISEYLYQEKWETAQNMLRELLKKQSMAKYQREPSALEPFIERTARKILDLGREK